MSEAPRRDKRITAERGLLVRCDSWAEFVQHYATDISQGGMFIVTDEPPEVLSEIDVQMSLPEGHDVLLRAQVVHVVDGAQAARDGRPAGIGVQFLALDAVRKAQIRQLIEFARWEGATDRPSASLASRMFEAAASLPPAKLMDAPPVQLPPAPLQPLSRSKAAAPAPRAASSPSNPAVNPSTAPEKPRPSRAPADRVAGATDRPESLPAPVASAAPPAAETGETAERAPEASVPPPIRTTGRPLDTDKLKLGMTHLAHRRFLEAINIFSELSTESPQDPQPVLWRALARARLKLKDKDESGAAEHYQQVLAIDENNHEARKFAREHGQKTRLNKLPFGRYFMKK